MKITKEFLEKARNVQSTEELISLAQDNGLELKEDAASRLSEALKNNTEISDEALDQITGGGGYLKYKDLPKYDRYTEEEL